MTSWQQELVNLEVRLDAAAHLAEKRLEHLRRHPELRVPRPDESITEAKTRIKLELLGDLLPLAEAIQLLSDHLNEPNAEN